MSCLAVQPRIIALVTGAAAASELPASTRAFADRFTINPGGLWGPKAENPNACSSSLGVSMAFDLVYPGSGGSCRTQIHETFGYPNAGGDQLVWAGVSARLRERYTGTADSPGRKKPIVRIANSIWVDKSTTLVPTYTRIVGDSVQQIDFEDGAAHVNAWCSEATEGLIPEMLKPGKIEGKLLAVNAIYLNASWDKDFSDRHTTEDMFYTSSAREASSASTSHFMHQVAYFDYSASAVPGFQLLKMPYAASSLSMLVALPMSAAAPASSAAIVAALSKLERRRVALALPKFKFQSSFESTVKSTLQDLGMIAPWGGGFNSIVEGAELYIAGVLHKTFLYVWEKGTEAAAVTAIDVQVTSVGRPPEAPVLFQADHAFQFWIYDQQEDLVLFEGRVGSPGVIDGSIARSTAKHKDEDFWTGQFGNDANPITNWAEATTQLSTLFGFSYLWCFS
mmetsp:Transcript_88352/g.248888  ORF Transcript_88352/g.248888 Transcript_88352/m.248888 type:complete len:451 (+) Transcript_88352:112-1464(+)